MLLENAYRRSWLALHEIQPHAVLEANGIGLVAPAVGVDVKQPRGNPGVQVLQFRRRDQALAQVRAPSRKALHEKDRLQQGKITLERHLCREGRP